MSKGLAVLGATGTIGANTLEIVERFPGEFHLVALSAGRNIEKFREQVRRFRPRLACVQEETAARDLAREFPDTTVEYGEVGLKACVTHPDVDTVVMGIVGFAALSPTLEAIRAHKHLALANKETLVVAGSLLRKELLMSRARCIPVDSEHNALFQLLEGRSREHVSSLVLTASGGPLLRLPGLPLEDVTPEVAIAHPNWKMGPKISVDSATLMNKGLELIEAHFLFDFPPTQIEVWIHPQSILHGAIWLTDNTCLAQLSKPDMKSSIGFALRYPEKLASVIPKLSLRDMARLEFFEPDTRRFPALDLARHALSAGPSHLVALNAANEIAVELFLKGKLLFPQIAAVIDTVLASHAGVAVDCLEAIFEEDRKARVRAGEAAGAYRT